jgi:hypothetical protein
MKVQAALKDFNMKATLDASSYEVAKIYEVADAQKASFAGQESQRAAYNAAVDQLADLQAANVIYHADVAMNTIKDHAIATVDAAASEMEKRAKQVFQMGGAGKDQGLGMGTDTYGNKYYLQPGQTTYAPAPGGQGLGPVAFKASGGPVSGGSSYVVGEKGPELFVPTSNGTIVPNGGNNARQTSVVNHIYVNGTAADVARQVADEILHSIKQGQMLA